MDDNLSWVLPSEDLDFWKIASQSDIVAIKWKHHPHEDYKQLAYSYYVCGYATFDDVISSGHNNIKSDMWFLTAIFLIRQSIELGLKSLICRNSTRNSDIQDIFIDCKHDLFRLFGRYRSISTELYMNQEESSWLEKYLKSLEKIDSKSDLFRFPFEDEFLANYDNTFLDNVEVANRLLQAFFLVKKAIEKGTVGKTEQFNSELKPEFFSFASHGIGNCHLWQSISDNGFHVKVRGYVEVIDFIYEIKSISNEGKLYPLLFMLRNALELSLKRIFYSRIEDGVPQNVFYSKRKSHLIKKDLWKNVKPVILKYAQESGENTTIIDYAEKQLLEINAIDKNGDVFRYPTSYSLEYRFDNKQVDLCNVYKFFKSLINFLDGSDIMLQNIADYQIEMLTSRIF